MSVGLDRKMASCQGSSGHRMLCSGKLWFRPDSSLGRVGLDARKYGNADWLGRKFTTLKRMGERILSLPLTTEGTPSKSLPHRGRLFRCQNS